jgi:hypothetical protein
MSSNHFTDFPPIQPVRVREMSSIRGIWMEMRIVITSDIEQNRLVILNGVQWDNTNFSFIAFSFIRRNIYKKKLSEKGPVYSEIEIRKKKKKNTNYGFE